MTDHDVVVVGGTPGGITAAIAAARRGHDAALLVRDDHVGGLPANGLGATDIGTRGATGGLFATFVERVREHYAETYGPNSPQVADCDGGYHFEPSVAEAVFEAMLEEHPIDVRRGHEFVAEPGNVDVGGRAVTVTNRETGATERHAGHALIDATYEGDLAAAAGAPFRIGREPKSEFDEPLAGKVYKEWAGPTGAGSTGEGDNAIQAYNYRLCLTRDDDNKRPVEKPENYDRSEYVSLIGDVEAGRTTDAHGHVPEGMDRVVNMVELPNGKVDANNQHAAFISTDLPEENWPWPTSFPAWRERFAERLREYTLGLLWFAQNDPELPESFKEQTREWGLAADEYEDNEGFPRQVYVREGRRVEGEHLFTAHDALPEREDERPPLHRTSVTASHYSLDSHAVRKREPGRVHLDGFLNTPTEPYTVPYGVIVPQKPAGLLTPVPVSGTHVGFSTLRMEPCWMALGEAAGTAAALGAERGIEPRDVPLPALQRALLDAGATLVYYKDAGPDHPAYPALQFLGVRGFVPEWEARLDDPVDPGTAEEWIAWAGVGPEHEPGETRGELLARLDGAIEGLPPERVAEIGAPD